MQLPAPKTPRKAPQWGKTSKTVAFWFLLILVPVAIMQFSGKGAAEAPEINYSPDFDRELDRGNIQSVSIQGTDLIVGEFKQKVSVNKRPVSRFTVRMPGP
ncbi:MAG: cell division protein FtsH, partial [Gemmatimonadaceae bacterium]|nr:cell division protein FtsH [Gemmatimonadaceae bacterium]